MALALAGCAANPGSESSTRFVAVKFVWAVLRITAGPLLPTFCERELPWEMNSNTARSADGMVETPTDPVVCAVPWMRVPRMLSVMCSERLIGSAPAAIRRVDTSTYAFGCDNSRRMARTNSGAWPTSLIILNR